jgi:pilus assembly protein CpaF
MDGTPELSALRKRTLYQLIDEISLASIRDENDTLRHRVENTIDRMLFSAGLGNAVMREKLRVELADEALGLGPLEGLLRDDDISEIMVISPDKIFVERRGRIERAACTFSSADSVRTVIERIVTPLGRRIDESSPMVDARLPDGSRVNAVIPPLAIQGPTITIRKFSQRVLSLNDLVKLKTLSAWMAEGLQRAVQYRKNIVISGGTGSGKTTLLNVLCAQIHGCERIITIEDAAELQLDQPHVVSLEARLPNAEGRGEITIRDLVRNALRMRPDRIIVGECRGGEALDMLQAMNTGHDGSMTTTHANSPYEALLRLETLCLMSGVDLPLRAIREQISQSVHLIVQQKRFADGKRRISAFTELAGLDDDGNYRLHDICHYRHPHRGDGGFVPTGRVASYEEQWEETT